MKNQLKINLRYKNNVKWSTKCNKSWYRVIDIHLKSSLLFIDNEKSMKNQLKLQEQCKMKH